MRDWFLSFSLLTSREKSKGSFCLLLWKHLPGTNSKSCSERRTKFLFKLSFALTGRFILVYNHSRFSEQFSESKAGFGRTLKGTGGYQKARTSSLRRVTGRNFTISKWFHRSKQKFDFVFPSQKENWKLWKPLALIQKVSNLGRSTKIFISWHYPFKCWIRIKTNAVPKHWF